jgi:hypothetical protein
LIVANIYEQIIGDLKAEKKSWCKESYHAFDGKTVSVCLVGAVERAAGSAYIKPSGKPFVTKDAKKVERAARVVNHLAGLLSPDAEFVGAVERSTLLFMPRVAAESNDDPISGGADRYADGAGTVIDFNDDDDTKKADVIRLLKKAARTYPND